MQIEGLYPCGNGSVCKALLFRDKNRQERYLTMSNASTSNTSTSNNSSVSNWIFDLSARVSTRVSRLYDIYKSVDSPYFLRFIFLCFCVFTSKGFIIFNEEVLVALAFVLFLDSFIYGFRDSIQDALDERSQSIHNELKGSTSLKKRYITDSMEDLRQISTGRDSVFIVDLLMECGESTKAYLREIEQSQKITFKTFVNSRVKCDLLSSLSYLRRHSRPYIQADLAKHFVCSAFYTVSLIDHDTR